MTDMLEQISSNIYLPLFVSSLYFKASFPTPEPTVYVNGGRHPIIGGGAE